MEFLLVFAVLVAAMGIIVSEFNKTTDTARFLICVKSAEYALDDIKLGAEKLLILGDGNQYFVRLDPGQCEFDIRATGNEVAITATYKNLAKSIVRKLDTGAISFSETVNEGKKLVLSLVLGNIQFNVVEP